MRNNILLALFVIEVGCILLAIYVRSHFPIAVNAIDASPPVAKRAVIQIEDGECYQITAVSGERMQIWEVDTTDGKVTARYIGERW